MREIATSQYDFAALREGDRCVYVDKTDILAKLPPIRQIRERGYAEPFRAKAPADARAHVDAIVSIASRRKNPSSSDAFETNASTRRRHPASTQPVTLVGIKFDPKIRNIDVPKFEPL